MKIPYFLTLFLLVIPPAATADFSLDRLKDGASKAAKSVTETAGDAADATGKAVGKATDSVTETIDTTKEGLRDEATPEATRAKLDTMEEATLDRLLAEQPETRTLFEQSLGYAVFDAREASFYVVAGYGRGVAVDRRSGSRTYMKMATGGAGVSLGIGGFEQQIVILFEDAGKLAEFLSHGMDATAQAGTMVGEEKDQLAMRFNEGKAVFVLTKKGWRVAAKLTGSRYWPDEELN